MPTATPPLLRVAIIGSGLGGLGTAIALSALLNVQISFFEQATEFREIGAGIRIRYNCWRVLSLLNGVDKDVKGHLKLEVLYRNCLTGEIIGAREPSSQPLSYKLQRVRRTRLQSALKAKVPKEIIQLKKKLVSLENLKEGGVKLYFEDGIENVADLVVGGDGIRSVMREHTFPDHSIRFTGTTIWRVFIPKSSIAHVPDLTKATAWWYGPAGHFYGSLVDDPNVVDPATVTEKRFSWGIPVSKEKVESYFTEYDPEVKEALAPVPEGQWKEFSAFAGPRLETLTAWDKIVLIGDASHPLSGAFGSGAAFALEDGWILARAIEHTRYSFSPIPEALKILMPSILLTISEYRYQHIDSQKKKIQEAKIANPKQTFEKSLKVRAITFWGEDILSWIYGNDIEKVWEKYLEDEKLARGVQGVGLTS